MTQTQQIHKYLMEGREITPIDALQKFGCFRLAARISDLRLAGLNIETQIVKKDDKTFASYKLKK